MRPTLAVVFFSLLAAARPLAADRGTPSPTLTLADTVSEALARNARLMDARDRVEQARLSLRVARAEFRPKVNPSAFGSFGQTDVSNQSYGLDVSQRFTTGTSLRATVGAVTARNQLGDFYSTDTTLQISQSLLRGFGRESARRVLTSAEVGAAEAARAQEMSRQQVAIEVASAYYAIVSQQQLVDVADKTLERSRRLLEASTAKLGVGKVSQLDVFRAQQLVALAEGQVVDALAGVEDAKDQLRALLGRGSDYEFSVVMDIPPNPSRLPVEEAVRLALASRLELQNGAAAVAEAERAATFSRNQLLPQFDVNVAMTRRETATTFGSSFGLDNFRFVTFLGVSMPMNRTAEAVAFQTMLLERDRRVRDLEALRLRIEAEARRAVRQQDRLLNALASANASIEFAEKEVELATLRYQRGLSNNLDVVNAENSLLAARARRLGMLADLAVTRLQLRATLGILDPEKDVRLQP
ncbi:MAG: TolC family protein [Acidobacteria bacterium]|nr:TolC family protein [Acidobacteriota bacterium]